MKGLGTMVAIAFLSFAQAQNFPDVDYIWTGEPFNGLLASGLLEPSRGPVPRPEYRINPRTNLWQRLDEPPNRQAWAKALVNGANNVFALIGQSEPHQGGWIRAEGELGDTRLRLALRELPNLKRAVSTLEKEIVSLGVDVEGLKRRLAAARERLELAITIPFPDVPKRHWAKAALGELKGAGLIRGYLPK